MPKANAALSNADIALISSMKARGYSNKEIADKLNVSATTVTKYLND